MSFNFFKQFKLKSPSELVKVTREALLALDSKTVAEVRLLEKALEEVDKNLVAMKHMLLGEGDAEPNPEQVSQLTVEACKDDFLELLVQKLPSLGWDARKDSVNIWCTLLRQNVGGRQYGLEFIEKHTELLDFLVSCYETKEIALNCGNMLRECARYPSLAKYMLESASFELFFKYVELPNFDIASDAFSTFKDLLTRHEAIVCEYLTTHYIQDPSKNIQSSAFHVFKVFVANPNKTPAIVNILYKNREKLLRFIDNFHLDKEDEQFEEEKELLIKEIELLQPVGH